MWQKGESGNPKGAQKEKRFLNALERAITQDDGKKLRDAADKLLDCAANGEPWAIQQLADRLDGKPTQQVDMNISRSTRELGDDELNDIAAGSGNRTAGEAQSTAKPSELH